MTHPRIDYRGTAIKQAAQCFTCLFKGELELQCEAGGAIALRVVDAKERRDRFIRRQGRHQPSSSPVDMTAAAPARAAFVTNHDQNGGSDHCGGDSGDS